MPDLRLTEWSEEDIAARAEVTPSDVDDARVRWRRDAHPTFEGLASARLQFDPPEGPDGPDGDA
jgi:hypothetical protein